MTDATDELVAEIKAGLEGVTPGPWFKSGVRFRMGGGEWHSIARYDDLKKTDVGVAIVGFDPRTGEGMADANWIARCSPDNIAAILSRLEAETARADEWKAAYGQACDDYAAIVKQTIEQKAENARLAAELAEAQKWSGILNMLDPENAIDDELLRDLHARLQQHGEKYPDRAVPVLHRNVVLYTIQASARAWHERNG